jgi:Type VI secretion system/phage-baseplate injector OB domain
MSQSLSPSAALGAQSTPTPATYGGVYPAKVYANNDPTHAGRIQMYIPQIFGAHPVKIWAPSCIAAGEVPEVGTVVWCLFQGGDPAYPVYIPASF